MNNETSGILYICVSGNWRHICSHIWGHTEATVACRQLYPGKIVISEQTIIINNIIYFFLFQHAGATPTKHDVHETQTVFMYHFWCTGQEMKLTDCSLISDFNHICNNHRWSGVHCKLGIDTLHSNTKLNKN